MEGWVPIPEHELDLSHEEFQAMLRGEVAALAPALRSLLGRYEVEPLRGPFTWDSGDEPRTKAVWILARSGDVVAGYDEVEEEYGTGRLGASGIEDWGTHGDRLAWTLQAFAQQVQGGSG